MASVGSLASQLASARLPIFVIVLPQPEKYIRPNKQSFSVDFSMLELGAKSLWLFARESSDEINDFNREVAVLRNVTTRCLGSLCVKRKKTSHKLIFFLGGRYQGKLERYF